ncbi:MAG TPA: VOC family protein, partial [Thermoanaerobaculia bacterium]|nr:VOC family protein [Thermoanaerobaculia bacterium]
MLNQSRAFSSFSVDDVERTRTFYAQTLGLDVGGVDGMPELLELRLSTGARVMVYAKPNHEPASFTVLNFRVKDLEATVEELKRRGVKFEIYDAGPVRTDDRGISTGEGPKMAWFRDNAGNILSV